MFLKKRPINLIQVQNQKAEAADNEKADATDNTYYLKVTSPSKALKDSSIHKQFCARYEDGLCRIVQGITSKGGIKKYDWVNQRIGRLTQKYPPAFDTFKNRIFQRGYY